MQRLGRYKPADRMSDLVCENYSILFVMSRFGIALGFGDRSIDAVCRQNDVDTTTFLAVVNMMLDDDPQPVRGEDTPISVEGFLRYLHSSHDYFLDYRLPAIRVKLAEAIDNPHTDVSVVVMRFFDEYAAEVRRHMIYEEHTVFPYVRRLLAGEASPGYDITVFERQHDQIEAKITELKNILIKYYPAEYSNELNSVLFDIFQCESDLALHNMVENNLFVPVVMALERKMRGEA